MDIKLGCEYWLVDGTKVSVASIDPLIVYEIVEVETYEGYYETEGRMHYCAKSDIFESPPVAVLNEEVAELKAHIDKLKKEKIVIHNELIHEENKRNELIKKFSSVDDALSNLNDIFNSNINYFVSISYYGGEILKGVPELIKEMQSRSNENGKYYIMRLELYRGFDGFVWTLSGKYKKYSEYLDEKNVFPCSTLEEAREVLKRELNKKIESGNVSQSILNCFKKYEIYPPGDYELRIKQSNAESIRSSIRSKQKEIDDLNEQLKQYE